MTCFNELGFTAATAWPFIWFMDLIRYRIGAAAMVAILDVAWAGWLRRRLVRIRALADGQQLLEFARSMGTVLAFASRNRRLGELSPRREQNLLRLGPVWLGLVRGQFLHLHRAARCLVLLDASADAPTAALSVVSPRTSPVIGADTLDRPFVSGGRSPGAGALSTRRAARRAGSPSRDFPADDLDGAAQRHGPQWRRTAATQLAGRLVGGGGLPPRCTTKCTMPTAGVAASPAPSIRNIASICRT